MENFIRYIIWDRNEYQLEDAIVKIYKTRRHAVNFLQKYNDNKIFIAESDNEYLGESGSRSLANDSGFACTRMIFSKRPNKLYLLKTEEDRMDDTTVYYLCENMKAVIDICEITYGQLRGYLREDHSESSDYYTDYLEYDNLESFLADIIKNKAATYYGVDFSLAVIKVNKLPKFSS